MANEEENADLPRTYFEITRIDNGKRTEKPKDYYVVQIFDGRFIGPNGSLLVNIHNARRFNLKGAKAQQTAWRIWKLNEIQYNELKIAEERPENAYVEEKYISNPDNYKYPKKSK